MSEIKPEEVLEYLIGCPEGTRLYLGADSERFRIKGVWHARHNVVFVVHLPRNGAHVFGESFVERDYDSNISRPFNRMMTEVYKVSDLFNRLRDVIEASGFAYEIHLDISQDEMNGSNVAMNAAAGYIKGVTGVDPKFKPDSPCASFCADKWGDIKNYQTVAGYENLSYKKKNKIRELV